MRNATPAALLDEIETLREENRQLRDLLLPPAGLPRHWKLTRTESRVVRALAAGNGAPMCVERLLGAVYGVGHDRDEGVIRVAMVKIRRKHDLHGLTVKTDRCYGYVMAPESCAAVRAAVAQASPKPLRGGTWASAPIGAPAAAA